MNALTEAITKQYQRQQELLDKQNAQLFALDELQGKLDHDILWCLRDAIYEYHKPIFERIAIIINTLEGVRDATD